MKIAKDENKEGKITTISTTTLVTRVVMRGITAHNQKGYYFMDAYGIFTMEEVMKHGFKDFFRFKKI